MISETLKAKFQRWRSTLFALALGAVVYVMLFPHALTLLTGVWPQRAGYYVRPFYDPLLDGADTANIKATVETEWRLYHEALLERATEADYVYHKQQLAQYYSADQFERQSALIDRYLRSHGYFEPLVGYGLTARTYQRIDVLGDKAQVVIDVISWREWRHTGSSKVVQYRTIGGAQFTIELARVSQSGQWIITRQRLKIMPGYGP